MSNYSVPITREKLAAYRGGGGFELLARSIEALESTNFAAIAETCKNNQLDGLVLCGGARTHTVSAYLSEYLMGHGCTTKVSHTNTCYHPCILSMQCTYTLSQLNTSPHTLPLTTPLYLYHHPHSLTPPSHHPLTPPPLFQVVCVPVGTSGSFKNAFVETTVGFNTSTKVAGQIVGNNATDGRRMDTNTSSRTY